MILITSCARLLRFLLFIGLCFLFMPFLTINKTIAATKTKHPDEISVLLFNL